MLKVRCTAAAAFLAAAVSPLCSSQNTVAGAHSTSAGGQNNLVSGAWAIALSGAGNRVLGDYAGAGGAGCEADGVADFCWGIGSVSSGGGSAMGRNLRATGTDTHVTGQGNSALADNGGADGWSNISSGMQGWASGHQSNDRGGIGARAFASGSKRTSGDAGKGTADAQFRLMVQRSVATDSSPTPSTSDGRPPGFTNQIYLPDHASYTIQWTVDCANSAGESRGWVVFAKARRTAGAATTTVAAPYVIDVGSTSGATAWSVSVATDTYNGAAVLRVASAAGVECTATAFSTENVVLAGSGPPSAISITTSSLPNATVGVTYSTNLTAAGGTAPYSWRATGMPSGLTLSGATITGVPATSGTSTVVATATDSVGQSGSGSLTLTVGAAGKGNKIPPDNQIVVAAGVARGTWTLVNGRPRIKGAPTYGDPPVDTIYWTGSSLIIRTTYMGAQWWVYTGAPTYWDYWTGPTP